ncbi:MAG TPA: zf-HC2 domain-containing protein [Steroidobacteraceae bacterium]|nr:zf-HC2 domain-containing protein [Steroidobacteraceae bacterium]
MSDNLRPDEAPEHQEISALIPWYVNASIGERERQRVELHLGLCAACRDELQWQRRLYQGMTVDDGVEHMPAPSLRRLRGRLDALERAAPRIAASRGRAHAPRPRRRPLPWRGLTAASIAVLAFALGLLSAVQWIHRGAYPPASYYTVTTPTARAPHEVIRAVFAPATTVRELKAILDDAQLRIVAGPTEAGVYSLAANTARDVGVSLKKLREHGAVRFAERIQPAADADAAR